jgi:hypothetical protein
MSFELLDYIHNERRSGTSGWHATWRGLLAGKGSGVQVVGNPVTARLGRSLHRPSPSSLERVKGVRNDPTSSH